MYLFNFEIEQVGCHGIVEQFGILNVSSSSQEPLVVIFDTLESPTRESTTLCSGFFDVVSCDQAPQAEMAT